MTLRRLAINNVTRSLRKYAAFYLSSAFSVMVCFLCALLIFHPELSDGDVVGRVAKQTLSAAVGIVYLFCWLFVLFSVASFLQSRRREIGILLTQGMTPRQLKQMLFMENMLIGTGSIVTGLGAGLLLGKLFLMIFAEWIDLPVLPFYVPWRAAGLTAVLFAFLFAPISALAFGWAERTPALGLVQGRQRNNGSQTGVSRAGAAASAVLLVTAYTLSATAKAAAVPVRMAPVVLITLAGTYLFYTHLSVYAAELLQRRRKVYWRKAPLIVLSGLADRWKDYARMFFTVTIVSAVSFTSVGMFASIHTLAGRLTLDYPAAIGYLAKAGEPAAATNRRLDTIRSELKNKGLAYEVFEADIKFADVESSTGKDRLTQLPLLSESSYRQLLARAGLPVNEPPLADGEGRVMIGSQRDNSLIKDRFLTEYRLQSGSLTLRETGYTGQVAIPEYVLPEMDGRDGGDFTGLVVSDAFFQAVKAERTERYTAFYVHDFRLTSGLAESLAKDGKQPYESKAGYSLAVSGTLFDVQHTRYSTMLFAALLVGTVFFMAAGSFLYYRLYMDLDADRERYFTLTRLGLTGRELSRVVSLQLALLFFVPVVLAIVHSLFAFAALQRLFYLSIAFETGGVLFGFLTAQVLYFLLIRRRYLRNLLKQG